MDLSKLKAETKKVLSRVEDMLKIVSITKWANEHRDWRPQQLICVKGWN